MSLGTENITLSPTRIHSGYLKKRSAGFSRDWQRRYFVLTSQHLAYYHHPDDSAPRIRLPLISMTIRRGSVSIAFPSSSSAAAAAGTTGITGTTGRRFRLLTPSREYCLEAETEEEARQWMSALEMAIETCHQQMPLLPFSSDLADRHNPLTSGTASEGIPMIVGGRELCEELISRPGNDVCADCGVVRPTWTSTNLAILLCIDCSGVHRSLGCSVSRVRSLEYDSFLPETIQVLRQLGNAIMNDTIWEIEGDFAQRKSAILAKDNEVQAISNTDDTNLTAMSGGSNELRKKYILDKYLKRSFTGDSLTTSPVTSPRGPATLFSPEAELFTVVHATHLERTAQLLFWHGVDPNLLSRHTNRTPLHEAAEAGQLLQVHLLLLNGASPLARDREGRLPAEIADGAGFNKVAAHLRYYERMWIRGARQSPNNADGTDVIVGKGGDDEMTGRIEEQLKSMSS